MKNTKFSIKKIKNISNDPKVVHTKGALLEKMGKMESAIELYKSAALDNYVKSQYTMKVKNNLKKQKSGIQWHIKVEVKMLLLI